MRSPKLCGSVCYRNVRRRILSIALVAALFASFATEGSATWNKIGQFSALGRVSASWFFNPMVGIIGFNGLSGPGMVQLTTDGGASWHNCTTPNIVNAASWVTDIWFSDSANGWLTIYKVNTTDPTLWRTTDAGWTWTGVPGFPKATSPSSVRLTSRALIVAQTQGVGVMISTDSGKTFPGSFNTRKNGLGFLGNNGVVTAWRGGFLYTQDGGLNWSTSLINFTHEGWGVYPVPGSQTFVAVAEDSIQAGGSRIYRSTTGGVNWALVTQLPFRANGAIQGVGEMIYVQNSNTIPGSPAGLYRSTDRGSTWVNVGGPNEDVDIRFSVTGCGNVIYAFDQSGGVWKTTDGGDGAPLGPCTFLFSDTLRPAVASICDSAYGKYWLHNPNVKDISLLDLRIVDSTRRPAKTTSVTLDSLPAPFETILPQDSLPFYINWHPNRMMDSTAADTAIVRAIFWAPYLYAYDTVYMTVHLRGFSLPPQFALSAKSVRIDSVTTCTPVDSIVDLVNLGCDSLLISKAFLLQNKGWTLTDSLGNPIKLPVKIASGEALSLHLRDNPRSPKVSFDSLRVNMHYMGKDTSFGVGMRSTAKLAGPFQTPATMVFDSLATCAFTDSLLHIANTGCDTVFIRRADLGGTDWSIFDANGNPVTYPIVILPGETGAIKLHFKPKNIGPATGAIAVHYHYLDFDSTNTIALQGAGVPSGTLSYSHSFDLGKVSICDVLDTVYTFHNTSCDPALVDSLRLPKPFVLLDSLKLPATVASGESVTFHIRYRPTAKTQETIHPELIYFVNSAKQRDTLNFSATGIGGSSTFETSPALAPVTFAAKSECDGVDSVKYTVSNSGCDTMVVTSITYDGNIAPVIDGHMSKQLPLRVVHESSVELTVAISKLVAGNYSGNVHVQFSLADGSTHDTLIPVAFNVSQGQRKLQLDTKPKDFGIIRACITHDTTIVIRNRGCGAMTVSERTFTGSGFTINKIGTDPIVLLKDQTDTIHLTYDGTTRGTLGGVVTIRTNADPGSTTDLIQITGIAPPTDSVHFRIGFSKMPVAAGEKFDVTLTPDHAVTGKGLQSLSGVLGYHANSYVLGNAQGETGLSTATSSVMMGTDERVTFNLANSTDISLDPATPVFTASLTAMTADSVGGTIYIDSLTFNGSDKTYGCVLAGDALAVGSQYSIACGDSLIIHKLRGTALVSADIIRPNPITVESNYSAILNLRAATQGIAEISVLDAMGRIVTRGAIPMKSKELTPFTFDLREQPAGSYFYEVHFTSEAGRGTLSGAIMLVK